MSVEVQNSNNDAYVAANEHLVNRNYQKALEYFLEAMKKGEGEIIVFMKYKIAFCYEKLGQIDSAFLAYADVVEMVEKLPVKTVSSKIHELMLQSRGAIGSLCVSGEQ